MSNRQHVSEMLDSMGFSSQTIKKTLEGAGQLGFDIGSLVTVAIELELKQNPCASGKNGPMDMDECTICIESLGKDADCLILKCGHKFHKTCLMEWRNGAEESNRRCPICRALIHQSFIDHATQRSRSRSADLFEGGGMGTFSARLLRRGTTEEIRDLAVEQDGTTSWSRSIANAVGREQSRQHDSSECCETCDIPSKQIMNAAVKVFTFLNPVLLLWSLSNLAIPNESFGGLAIWTFTASVCASVCCCGIHMQHEEEKNTIKKALLVIFSLFAIATCFIPRSPS